MRLGLGKSKGSINFGTDVFDEDRNVPTQLPKVDRPIASNDPP